MLIQTNKQTHYSNVFMNKNPTNTHEAQLASLPVSNRDVQDSNPCPRYNYSKGFVGITWQISQIANTLEDGWRSEKRWCLEASLLAWWTPWSQASQRAASSAVQNTEASSLLQTSHWIFICLSQ